MRRSSQRWGWIAAWRAANVQAFEEIDAALRALGEEGIDLFEDGIPIDRPDPSSIVVSEERDARIRKAILKLQVREILTLCWRSRGLPLRECGRRLGCSGEYVRQIELRARLTLFRELKRLGVVNPEDGVKLVQNGTRAESPVDANSRTSETHHRGK